MKQRRAFDKRGALAMRADLWGATFDVGEPPPDFELRGNAAIVTIEGPLTHHPEWLWDSYDAIKARVTAAIDSGSPFVVLKIDSPGGDVSGCFETVRALRAYAATKGVRVVAYADGMAASAGYALACIGESICLPKTGFVGSIGCISTLFDMTGYDEKNGFNVEVIASGEKKRFGHPNVPISKDAIANTQSQVDALAGFFFELVSESRGLSPAAVSGLDAGMLLGTDAVAAKLADRVCTFDELLEDLSSGGNTTAPRAAAEEKAMGWKDEMKKAAADGDEDAKKCLDAMDDEEPKEATEEPKGGSGEGEDKPADDKDKDPPSPKKESAEEPKDEDGDKSARARSSAKAKTPEQRIAALEERDERDRLLAKRPDFANDAALAKRMSSAPIEVVRWNVDNLARVAVPAKAPAAVKPTSPLAHAAASTPGVTRAGGEGGAANGVTRKSPRADELDAALGFASAKDPIIREGNQLGIRLMTPKQAREHVKKLDARNAQMSGGN